MPPFKPWSALVLITLLLGALAPGSAGVSGRALQNEVEAALPGTPSWIYYTGQLGSETGQAVAPAGDVNADGYADVLVTAPKYTSSVNREGIAMLFLGGPGGLASYPVWSASSGQQGSYYGNAAHTAFDLNGDGRDDIIVGAMKYKNLYSEEGAAFVYYGTSTGLSPAPAWSFYGGQKEAQLGSAVGPAGDVNGDGYADVVVGARWYKNTYDREGAVFIFYGSPGGLSADPDLAFYGGKTNAQLGASAMYAGDINNDGYDDLVAGAPYYSSEAAAAAGAVYVFYGSPGGLKAASGSPIAGEQSRMGLGMSVYPAGDLNHDGHADVVAGAPFYTGEEVDEGAAYVYFGTPDGLDPTPQWTLTGGHTYSRYGEQVGSTALFGGNYGAVLVGAPNYTDDQPSEGRIFLYQSSGGGPPQAPFWCAEGNKADAFLGSSVAAAGDINGNGLADIVAGAPLYRRETDIVGQAFAYYALHREEVPVTTHYLYLPSINR